MNSIFTINLTSIVMNFLLHSTILLSLGLLFSSLMQKRGAAVQSAILRTTFCLALLTPALSTAMFALNAPGLRLAVPNPGGEREIIPPIDAIKPQTQSSEPIETQFTTLAASNPNGYQNRLPKESITPKSNGFSSILHFPLTGRIVSASWILISALLGLQLGIRYRSVKRLRRDAWPANAGTEQHCRSIADELSVACPQILTHPNVQSPFLLGVRRPAILLPQSDEDSEIASREVILHELAHLIRNDVFWNYLCRFSECLFFFQPLLWALNRQIGKTSDYACDDYVVQHSDNRTSYARQLTNLAARMQPIPAESLIGTGVISFRSFLGIRVQRILDRSRKVTLRAGRTAVVSILIVGLASFTLTGLIGFQNSKNPAKKNLVATNDIPKTDEEPSTPGELLPTIYSHPDKNGSEQSVELMDCTISLIAVLAPNGADWTPTGEKFDWSEWIRANVEEPYQNKAIEYQKKVDGWREDCLKYIDGVRAINNSMNFPIGILFSIQYSSEKIKSIHIQREEKSVISPGSSFPMMITPTLQLYSIRGYLQSNASPLEIETPIVYGPYLHEKLYIAPQTRNLTTVFLNHIMTISVWNKPNPSLDRINARRADLPATFQNPPRYYPAVSIIPHECDSLVGYEVFAVNKEGISSHWSSYNDTTEEWNFFDEKSITYEMIDYFLYCGRRIRPVIWKNVEMKNAQKILEEFLALPPKQPTPDSQKDSQTSANATLEMSINESFHYLNYFQRYLNMLSREPRAKEKMQDFLAQVDWEKVFDEFERAGNYNFYSAIESMIRYDLELDRAVLLAKKMVERNPQSYTFLMLYQTILLKQNRYQEVMPVIDRLVKIKPEIPEPLMNKAFILKSWKQYDESETCYKQVLEKHPAHPHALAGLVSLYKTLGKDPIPLVEENQKLRGIANTVTETDIAVP